MKILAIIPARQGSKRVPGKNIRNLGGKPLILWTLEIAKRLSRVCDTLISTDGQEIASIAKEAGGLVPWLRPEELSSDTATSLDVVLHAADWYESVRGSVDGLLLLQPTSPFRSAAEMEQGINTFSDNPDTSVVGVSPALNHPQWTFKIEGAQLVPFLGREGLKIRSQDLPPAYCINGTFYLISPQTLRRERSFFLAGSMPLISENPGSRIDIDTEEDGREAERFLETGGER